MKFRFGNIKIWNKTNHKRQCFTEMQYQKFNDEAQKCKKDNSPVTVFSPIFVYNKGSELVNKEHFYVNDDIVEGCEYNVV